MSWRATSAAIFLLVDAVRKGRGPGHLQGWAEVASSAAQCERPAQDGAAEAVHHQGEIGPAVLTAPDRGHVGLPELVGLADVEGSALWLGMRPRQAQRVTPEPEQPLHLLRFTV